MAGIQPRAAEGVGKTKRGLRQPEVTTLTAPVRCSATRTLESSIAASTGRDILSAPHHRTRLSRRGMREGKGVMGSIVVAHHSAPFNFARDAWQSGRSNTAYAGREISSLTPSLRPELRYSPLLGDRAVMAFQSLKTCRFLFLSFFFFKKKNVKPDAFLFGKKKRERESRGRRFSRAERIENYDETIVPSSVNEAFL